MNLSQFQSLLTACANQDLSVLNLQILAHLRTCESYADTMSHIADAVGVSTAGITGNIDKMERSGFMVRNRDISGDRRSCFAQLTIKGVQFFDKINVTTPEELP